MKGGVPSAARSSFDAVVRRVLVLADGEKAEVRPRVAEVMAFLAERELETHLDEDVRGFCDLRKTKVRELSIDEPDLVVVLGGDGSVLTAVRAFGQRPIPVLGINYGRVGFLAPVEASGWKEGLLDALEGRAIQEMRMRIDVELSDRSILMALNDAVLTRSPDSGMVSIALFADGDRVGVYRADGLILATPSGSTAYSLAAGGPILAPTMEGIVATPLSAHALSHRPLVLSPDGELRMQLVAGSALVSVDGQSAGLLEVGQSISVRRSALSYPLLMPAGLDPWRRLEDRLGWRGSLPERD